jgi:DNA-binding IclR family transcriptional regulator
MSLNRSDLADKSEERRYRAPALEKGLDILELLASHGAAMTPSQIAARLDRSMSELFRMIQVLEYKGYITAAQTGDGYELSNRLFTLGMARAPVRTLLEAAMPVMRELAETVRQSCHLAVASDEQMVVVARIENPGQFGFSVRPGYRRGLTEATSGLVLYAFQPPEVRERWMGTLKAAKLGAKALSQFQARTDQVRQQGYAAEASDFVQGITDLSAPVMAGAAAAAALTVPYVQAMPPPATMEQTVQQLRAAASRISADLAAVQ